MENTLYEYLQELPEPWRTEAVQNTSTDEAAIADAGSCSNALFRAFDWSESPQGYDYWEEIYNHLCI